MRFLPRKCFHLRKVCVSVIDDERILFDSSVVLMKVTRISNEPLSPILWSEVAVLLLVEVAHLLGNRPLPHRNRVSGRDAIEGK